TALMLAIIIGLLLLLRTVASAAEPAAAPIRALLITGGHEHDIGFYSIFESYKEAVPITVSSSNIAFAKDIREKYDTIIMYDFSRDLDETGRKNLHDFAEGGKGIVVLHHALLNYQSWPWWYQEVVGGSYRLETADNISACT